MPELLDATLRARLDAVLNAEKPSEALLAARRPLLLWLTELQRWNAKVDLTAARSEAELVDLMVADAVVLHRETQTLLVEGSQALDVGSGAGAPGLPFALMSPHLQVRMLEPLGKRVSFLRRVLGQLAVDAQKHSERSAQAQPSSEAFLARVQLQQGRAEELPAECADLVFSRATLPPPAWAVEARRLTRRGGYYALLLAREPLPELAGDSVVSDTEYAWPLTEAMRRLVLVRKAGP